jgi:Mrp family chromosome partitioning ATPase/uncharacterized protein involved in exopolysaccharide biosynthesis
MRVLLFGILKRWPLIVIFAVLSMVGGPIIGSKLGGKKSFDAETIIRFQPTGEDSRYVDQKTTVLTLKDTIKIRENMEELRNRLGLKDDIGKLGKALDIHVQKNTTLLVVSVKWHTARGAAEIVNTLRDIFVEQYNKKRKDDIRRQMNDLNRRLSTVRADLRNRDRELQLFTTSNRIVDIEKQSRAMLEEYNNYGVLLEQSQAEKQTVDQQALKLDDAISQLKARVARESKNMAQLENLADVNTRIERIRDTIKEDKDTRANIAELALLKLEMDRMKRLYDKGYVSEFEYRKAETAYETQRIRTEDTDETRRMKEERAKLQQQIIPKEGGGTTPSGPILMEMLKRTFEIQLEQIAVTRKVASLQAARQKVKVQLDRVPILQQQYDALQRNIAAGEAERKDLEASLQVFQRDMDSQMNDFTIVSSAEVDKEADKAAGKSKIVGYAISFVGTLLGIALAGGWEMLDATVRSPQEAAAKLSPFPLLGTLPLRRGRRRPPLVTVAETDFAERLAVTARRLHRSVPRSHSCLLILATNPGEGVGTVSRNLAAALARQENRVLVVDLRPDALSRDAALFNALPEGPFLSSYLEGEAQNAEELIHLVQDKMNLVVRDTAAISPDRLGSQRMTSLLRSLSETHDLTLVSVTSPLKSSEAELLSGSVDGVILVVRAGKTPMKQIEKLKKKLESMKMPVVGVILNQARWPYIHWE